MGNDMFNDEQLADAKVRADAEILHHGYPCPMTDEQITEALWKLGGYSPEGCAVQQTVSFLRLALATATRERDEARASVSTHAGMAGTLAAQLVAAEAERDAAVARLNTIRDWASGLGWLDSPQSERAEAEALAILDGVDEWLSCPDYIRGLPHTECAKCGGFGAIPAPQKGAPDV